jgi:hypothetical protein
VEWEAGRECAVRLSVGGKVAAREMYVGAGFLSDTAYRVALRI